MEPRPGRSASILIIDDEQSLRDTFHFFLTREGYNPVTTAANFREAFSILQNQPTDLVISDIVLENSSGIDLLKHARQLGIDCPFIMVTGFPEVDSAAEAVRLGAFDYISKPIDKETLLKSVKLALRHRNLEQQKLAAEAERERYRLFLDKVFTSVTDAIIIVGADLSILKLNDAAHSLFKDLLPGIREGSNLESTIISEEFSSLHSDLLRVLKTGKEVSEHRFECNTLNNKTKILSICTSPFRENNSANRGAVIVIRDMSVQVKSPQKRRSTFHRFIGSSNAMQAVYTTIENVGRVDTTVLITGESGTGKELAAEALHLESDRKDMPLIKVDCTAMPENLLESELFGHKKGAFTGADKDRMGHIIQAEGGTLFLDEIGEISAVTQLRLLRFLQEKTFYPVGSDTEVVVDTRVITATNVDLKEKVLQGLFREDLYYRLRVIDVILPPLRQRAEDLLLLINHFVALFSKALGKTVNGLSDNAINALLSYHWPGNVRELEHVIERSLVLSQGSTISMRDLPPDLFTERVVPAPGSAAPPASTSVFQAVEPTSIEQDHITAQILETLRRCGGNKAKAARLLGIDRSTLYRKIKDHKIDISMIALE